MQPTTWNAQLGGIPDNQIPALAALYDRFAHALDPFSRECDHAESLFVSEVAGWYETIKPPKPSVHESRKAVIVTINFLHTNFL